jgi:hypothetical protein
LTVALVGCGSSTESDGSRPTIESGATEDEAATASSDTTAAEPTTSSSTTSSSTTTSTTSPSSSSSTIPTPDDGEAFDEYIADRIERFYELRDVALANPTATPEIDYPELASLAGEAQLTVLYDAIKDLHRNGQAYREIDDSIIGTTTDEEHRTSGVQTHDGDTITVFNCEVDDDDIVDVATGEVLIEGTLTVLGVLTLVNSNGLWKITDSEVTQKIEGVAGCYLASEAEFPY